MKGSWAADEAGLGAATKVAQGPVLDRDEDEDEDECEDKDEDEDDDKDMDEDEEEGPGGSDWSQKPGLGAHLI